MFLRNTFIESAIHVYSTIRSEVYLKEIYIPIDLG